MIRTVGRRTSAQRQAGCEVDPLLLRSADPFIIEVILRERAANWLVATSGTGITPDRYVRRFEVSPLTAAGVTM